MGRISKCEQWTCLFLSSEMYLPWIAIAAQSIDRQPAAPANTFKGWFVKSHAIFQLLSNHYYRSQKHRLQPFIQCKIWISSIAIQISPHPTVLPLPRCKTCENELLTLSKWRTRCMRTQAFFVDKYIYGVCDRIYHMYAHVHTLVHSEKLSRSKMIWMNVQGASTIRFGFHYSISRVSSHSQTFFDGHFLVSNQI